MGQELSEAEKFAEAYQTNKKMKASQSGTDDASTKPKRTRRGSVIAPGAFVRQRSDFSRRYKGLKVLGKGSFGEVILCRDRRTANEVAVKVISKSSVRKSAEKEALLKEVQLLKELDHPSIMKIYEYYEDKGHYYIVGEPYRGGELFDEIVKRKRFQESDAAEVMFQILSGLNYMHKNKVVHRDLKPENVLYVASGSSHLKIIDFGLSTHYQDQKAMKDKIGTAYYIAPEVLRGSYDEKCDIWSCGVIQYILLSGCPPFYGSNESEILRKVEVGKYTFNLPQWQKISDSAKHMIRMMLFYVPTMRMSAEACLQHEWLTGKLPKASASTKQIYQCLTNALVFGRTAQLGQAAMLYCASKLTKVEEADEFRKTFMMMDADGDGRVTVDDLIKAVRAHCNLGGKEASIRAVVESIFSMADLDQSGYMEFSEWMAIAMSKKQLLSDKRIRSAFDMFDANQDGKICDDELFEIFGSKSRLEKVEIRDMIRDLDKSGDGMVDFEEFKGILRTKVADEIGK